MAEDKIKISPIGIILALGGVGALIYFLTRKKEGTVRAAPVATAPVSAPTPAPTPKPMTAEGELKQIAMKELGLGEDELTVRSLRPEDLGVSGAWSFNIGTANAWNNIISSSLGDNRFLMITRVTYTGSAITQVRVVAGGSTKEVWSIQHIPAMETPTFIDLTPTIIKQNQSISIDVYATSAGTESLIFDGVVIEKKGLVLA